MRYATPALILAAWLSAAAAPPPDRMDEIWRELRTLAGPCGTSSGMHVLRADHEVPYLLGHLLRLPADRCDNVAARARARLVELVGEVERPDAEVGLLRVLAEAARQGLGGPADPELAERVGRVVWAFEEYPSSVRREAATAERQAWLERPSTIRLLEGRVALFDQARRARELLGELSLRRDLPSYDPARAVLMFEADGVTDTPAERMRLSRLLSDGQHLPPDLPRAGEAIMWDLNYNAESAQPEMLRLGRRAAAGARSQAERVGAARLLWAASIGGDRIAGTERGRAIAALGRVPTAPLGAGDGERIRRAMGFHISTLPGVSPYDDQLDARRRGPVEMRGLVAPNGRLALVELTRSSGDAELDRDILLAWSSWGRELDLSATARGRLVWVRLPTIPNPRSDGDAYD